MNTKKSILIRSISLVLAFAIACIGLFSNCTYVEAKSKKVSVMVSSNTMKTKGNTITIRGTKFGTTKKITMKFDSKTKLDDVSMLDHGESGDSASTWLKRLHKEGTIAGVYSVKMTGNHVDVVYQLGWWD